MENGLETIEKMDNINLEVEKSNELKSGIDGPLALFGFFIIVGILFRIYQFKDFINLYTNGTMAILSDKLHAFYNPKLFALISFEVCINIAMFILVVFIAYLFFSKKKLFVLFISIQLIANIIILILDSLFLNALNFEVATSEILKIIIQILVSAIWITYFIKSKRVKITFVNPLSKKKSYENI